MAIKTVAEIPNAKIKAWVEECVKMCEPDNVVVCDGSAAEYDALVKKCVDSGLATPLAKKPHSYLFRSDPSDVARVEKRTFISSKKQEDAGPTNNWIDPVELKATMKGLYKGCMHGRTMYVIPFCMGPLGSPISKCGIELTDSEYVVLNMDIMTRAGEKVWQYLDDNFVPCLHSVGKPLNNGEKDNGVWACAPVEQKYISQFPEEHLGLMVLDTAETLFSAKNVSLSESLLLSLTKKAGLLSTCSSLSSQTQRAKSNMLLAHSRQYVVRQTSLCLSRQSLAGRSRQSVMTLHG